MTRRCSSSSSAVGLTLAKKTPARSKQPSPSSLIGTGGRRSSPSRPTTPSYRSGSVLPRNCNVMCHDSGLHHRGPSRSDRSRAEATVNSRTTAAAKGIPTNRRIRSYLRRTSHSPSRFCRTPRGANQEISVAFPYKPSSLYLNIPFAWRHLDYPGAREQFGARHARCVTSRFLAMPRSSSPLPLSRFHKHARPDQRPLCRRCP